MVDIYASLSREIFLNISPLTMILFKETLYQNNEVSFYFQFVENFIMPKYRISSNTFTSFIEIWVYFHSVNVINYTDF